MNTRPCFFILSFMLFLHVNPANAQVYPVQIYPQVQQYSSTGDAIDFDGFHIENAKKWTALVSRTPVAKMLAADTNEGLILKLEIRKDIEAWNNPKNIAKADGAYDLSVTPGQVTIAARDSVGIFYGLQTLRQLIKGGKIYPAEIHDFPAVKYRGVVEGFYGTPWSQQDRMSQIAFYGRVKANTYIYGPKDDSYHSSPNWRMPYPPDQAANIEKLVKVANANFVHFVWAIHPGQDIKWNKEDQKNVLNKFQAMYKLGVRSFAVFFDDISGEGTRAEKQAGLLNYLTKHFVRKKKDVQPLILTPTDYTKAWAAPSLDNGYLAILGRELDPSIQVMWTGDNVMSDVTVSTLQWVNERIRRPALFWWNFPVSDYRRNELFIGPSYGLKNDVDAKLMSGILSNPMEHAEASKPAIFGVADYGWNTAAYDADKSWLQALKIMLPHSYRAYQLFGENNSNPEHGITSYIGKESQDIAPYLKRVQSQIKNQKADENDLTYLTGYFNRIKDAGRLIIRADDDSALIAEVKPWLNSFTELGREGLRQIENYHYRTLRPDGYWEQLVSNLQRSDYWTPPSFTAGDGAKTTPVTGTRVLRPFVKFLWQWNSEKLFKKIVGKNNIPAQDSVLGTIQSDNQSLKGSKLSVANDQEILLHPNRQSVKLKANESFSIELFHEMEGAVLTLTGYKKDSVDVTVQISADGRDWTKLPEQIAEGQISFTSDSPFKYIKISNPSSGEINFRFNGLAIKKKANAAGDNPFTTHDFDLLTAYTLNPGDVLTERSTVTNRPAKAIILTGSNTAVLSIKIKRSGAWQSLPQTYSGEYIEIALPEGVSEIQVSLAAANQPVRIYEVMWR